MSHADYCRAGCPDPPRRPDLTKNHGNPEEFKRAVWLTYQEGLITQEEAIRSINRYTNDYESALP